MTAEAQRIEIAEACGWTNVRETSFGLLGCHPKADLSALSDEYLCARTVPDYPNDLNACHEFEKILSTTPIYMQKHAFNNYAAMLCEMCKHEYNAIAATAPQRCEAFLKTINKWTNDR